MGGTDDPSNLVELTVEEHAEAHKTLWEKHGNKQDWLAWQGLSGLISKKDLLHELFVLAGKKSKPPKGHKANLGKKWSDEYKKKMSEACKGKILSEETKNKISKSNSRNWLITKPNGKKINITNLETFCKQNNLQSSKMSLVSLGIRKHHKNYLCKKIS